MHTVSGAGKKYISYQAKDVYNVPLKMEGRSESQILHDPIGTMKLLKILNTMLVWKRLEDMGH